MMLLINKNTYDTKTSLLMAILETELIKMEEMGKFIKSQISKNQEK